MRNDLIVILPTVATSVSDSESAWIAAGAALAGAFISGVVGQLIGYYLAGRRRWEPERQRVLAEFAASVNALWNAFDHDGNGPDDAVIGDLRTRVIAAYSIAGLVIQSKQTDRMIDELYETAGKVWTYQPEAGGFLALDAELHERLARFMDAARSELGLPSLSPA